MVGHKTTNSRNPALLEIRGTKLRSGANPELPPLLCFELVEVGRRDAAEGDDGSSQRRRYDRLPTLWLCRRLGIKIRALRRFRREENCARLTRSLADSESGGRFGTTAGQRGRQRLEEAGAEWGGRSERHGVDG